MERPMERNRKMVSKRRIGAMYVKHAMREIASYLAMTQYRIMHILSRFVIARRHDEAISPPSPEDSSVAFTRLTPRGYIKRTKCEIASCLAMTVGAGGFCNPKYSSFPDCLIENFLTLAMTAEDNNGRNGVILTFNS